MKLKEGIELIQFTGGNKKALEKFTGRKVTINRKIPRWPIANIDLPNTPFGIFKGDYIAKHGDKLIEIPQDIIKFLSHE